MSAWNKVRIIAFDPIILFDENVLNLYYSLFPQQYERQSVHLLTCHFLECVFVLTNKTIFEMNSLRNVIEINYISY